MLLLFTLLAGLGVAQRPSNASVCDYYAQARYGSNTSTTQHQLIEGIIALAFAGNKATSNASSSLTGIFNPGTFQDTEVDLLQFFDGSIDSTNLNNQPVGINWLDGGGLDPLYSYLNGTTPSIVLDDSTNQYRLFSHWYADFGQNFGCSNAPALPPSTTGQSGPIDLAYVHKFMNLNYTDLGYFIDQVAEATQYFGFSDEDAATLNGHWNSAYNVQCSPPEPDGTLQSLCLASNCPLAVPNPDCAAYLNITPNGAASIAPSGASATVVPTQYIPSAVTVSVATPTTSSSSNPTSVSSSDTSSTLAPSAIAGIAIGGAALLILTALAFLYWRYKSKKAAAAQQPTPSFASPQPLDPQYSLPSYFYQQSAPSEAYGSAPSSPPPPNMIKEPIYEVGGNDTGGGGRR